MVGETVREQLALADGAPPPGPWCASSHPVEQKVGGWPTYTYSVACHGHGRAIALVFAGHGDGRRTAALIAAAPNLLDAARAVVANWERGDLAGAVRELAGIVEELDQ